MPGGLPVPRVRNQPRHRVQLRRRGHAVQGRARQHGEQRGQTSGAARGDLPVPQHHGLPHASQGHQQPRQVEDHRERREGSLRDPHTDGPCGGVHYSGVGVSSRAGVLPD